MRTAIAIAVVLAALLALPQRAFAISAPTSIELVRADAYTDVLETGDVLFVGAFDIVYPDCNTSTQTGCPSDTVADAYLGTVIDDDGADPCGVGTTHFQSISPVVSTAAGFNGYNRGIFAIYVDSDDTGGLQVGEACHALEIEGNPALFASPPTDEKPVTWTSGTEFAITTAMRNRASELETNWGISLTQDAGEHLSTNGQDYFEAAVQDLRTMAPDLFAATVSAAEAHLSDFTNQKTYSEGLESFWTGTEFGDSFQAQLTLISTEWGIPLDVSRTMIALAFTGLAMFAVSAAVGDFRAGMLGGALVLPVMPIMSFGAMEMVAVITLLAALVLAWMVALKGA